MNTLINEINRFHTKDICIKSIYLLKKNGYNNINLDMMYGLPNQTLIDIKNDLEIIEKLDIQHISYYSLILEEKSVYGVKYKDLDTLLDEDLEHEMNLLINKTLKNSEFKHYEISNYSKENYESYHNKLYWKRYNYIGCGASAAGYIDGINTHNSNILSSYFNGESETYETSIEEQKQQFFWLGLRMLDGVDLDDYIAKFNEDPIQKFNINELIDKELLIKNNKNLRLTERGIMLGNIVFRHFIK